MADSHETATVTPDIPARFVSPFARRYLEGTGFSCEGEEDLYFYAEQGVGEFADSGQGKGLTIDDARKAAETGCPVAALVAALVAESNLDGKTLLSECHWMPSWEEAFRAIIKAAGMPELMVEGAMWCDKARPGEFGGWAALIEPERIQMGNTGSLLQRFRSNNDDIKAAMANNHETATVTPDIPVEFVSTFALDYLRGFGFSIEKSNSQNMDCFYFYAKNGISDVSENNLTAGDVWKAAEKGCPVAILIAGELEDGTDGDAPLTGLAGTTSTGLLPFWETALQAIIKAAGMPELVVEGATWCDKARPGEVGGWAALIEPERIQMGNTGSLLQGFRSNNKDDIKAAMADSHETAAARPDIPAKTASLLQKFREQESSESPWTDLDERVGEGSRNDGDGGVFTYKRIQARHVETVFEIKAGSREEADEIYYNSPPEPASRTIGSPVRHLDESLEVVEPRRRVETKADDADDSDPYNHGDPEPPELDDGDAYGDFCP